MFVVCRARLIKFILTTVLITYLELQIEAESKRNPSCFRGSFDAVAGICACLDGWFGHKCQFVRQRLTALEGIISDVPSEQGYSSKCLWLIEATEANSTIQLSVDQFWSTSPWYSLYIYNGSSFRAPLLAAFSGVKEENCTAQSVTGWIRTTSRSVLIYFFRDSNNVNSGFKLKYSINNCSSSCSYHGVCYDGGKCLCDPGWNGYNCSTPICPYTCIHGTCDTATWQCDCQSGWSGQSCNISSQYGTWAKHVATNQNIVQSRAVAGAGVIDDWLWVFGGFSLADKPLNKIIRYSFTRNIWQVVSIYNSSMDGPSIKYGHSLVIYNKLLIIFGGVTDKDNIVNSLWSFNTTTKTWTKPRRDYGDKPHAVAGHTATIVNNKMVVIFGYGPLYGFINKVQVYDLVTGEWKIIKSTKEATYGHTSHYDPITKLIYVYGGRSKGGYSDALHSYNLNTNHWTYLSGSKSPHFLHSSVLIGNMILVYGGNTFTHDKNKKCPRTGFMVYDINCNKWSTMPQTNLRPQNTGVGHSAIAHNSKLFIFGGFNGVMKNSMLSYSLGKCFFWKDKSSCNAAYRTSGCLWDPAVTTCISPEEGFSRLNTLDKPSCQEKCSTISSCGPCNAPGIDCKWCDGKCKQNSESCKESPPKECEFTSACKGPYCKIHYLRCDPTTINLGYDPSDCNKNCDQCLEVLGNSNLNLYMWCEANKQCVSIDSYVAVFPNGQCNDWITADCKVVKCSLYKSCDTCHAVPGCGWCDNNSGTGRGVCVEGGGDGPYTSSNLKQCPRWYYTECPVCQCNGHSVCGTGTSCLDCQDHTTGRRCEQCAEGHFGDPRNGGTCQECQCNGHAKHCHHKTSKCACLVEGIIGHRCERCDKERRYEGNATNGKLCYYRLMSNQRKVFNVSGKTSLNLKFIPLATDRDLTFEIKIINGPKALLNLSYARDISLFNKKEKVILKKKKFDMFSRKFSHRDYKFHEGKVIFQANIYDMDSTASFKIIAHFDQPSTLNINLLEFFLTFFGCFLSLLFVASIGWRIRSRYHSYLVTRQRRAERDRMANRPFATIHLLLPNDVETPILTKSSPNPVAMEPLAKNKVAIATVVVLLPAGEEGVTPVGQCGVCFGSMLMAHGSHQHHCLRARMGHKKPKKRATMTTYHL